MLARRTILYVGIAMLVYAVAFGPAVFLAVLCGLDAIGAAETVMKIVFYPHWYLCQTMEPYGSYIRWWDAMASDAVR